MRENHGTFTSSRSICWTAAAAVNTGSTGKGNADARIITRTSVGVTTI